eukprot:scaffold29690_cov59-Attheya_sp.AAC.5
MYLKRRSMYNTTPRLLRAFTRATKTLYRSRGIDEEAQRKYAVERLPILSKKGWQVLIALLLVAAFRLAFRKMIPSC